jgi:KilA-N domain
LLLTTKAASVLTTFRAGGFTKNQTPKEWARLQTTLSLISVTAEKKAGNSRSLTKEDLLSVYCVKNGRGGGIWADPNVALAYAKYLSPALHYEVNEVFLRHKAGDATLADETLQKAGPKANEWAGTRALGRAKRIEYTDTLRDHGVTGPGYAQCTDATYNSLFDASAANMRKKRGLAKKANVRDSMNTDELVYLMAAETLASGRIREENSQGNIECTTATSRSASFIHQAIEADKADRRKTAA